MSKQRINITIGTAGHIDHGKTALTRLLTGCETDRLREEKERGMSIELGFAPCTLAGQDIGIVDVPGHEHFIKTMVAGAAGIDAVILVVAADDGIMPQTLEHLQIVKLLGVESGIVALTKIDRVSRERVLEVTAALETMLSSTFLADAPILPVSGITGDGFDGFHKGLTALVESLTPRRTDGLFRMPVERAFSAAGFGTVVSGIPVSGSASLQDEVVLLPQGLTGKIRGIEVYGDKSDVVMAGQCAALQFRHWDKGSISRGDVLTVAGYFEPTEWLLAQVEILTSTPRPLESGARVRLHTGTADVSARAYPLEGTEIRPGESGLLQIRVDAPVVIGPKDRYVIRALSPVTTIGGGMIVEALPRRMKRNRPEVAAMAREAASTVSDDAAFFEHIVKRHGLSGVSVQAVARTAKLANETLSPILNECIQKGLIIGLPNSSFIHRESADAAMERILRALEEFHKAAPDRAGIPLEDLREQLGFESALFDGLVQEMTHEGKAARSGGLLCLADHRARVDDEARNAADMVSDVFLKRLFNPPSIEEIIAETRLSAGEVENAVTLLIEWEGLVRVSRDLIFHQHAIHSAREKIAKHIKANGELRSVDFKYLVDTSRKYAIPLLDYFDNVRFTLRVGNTRYLRDS